jgi:hypothetical protein
LAKSPEEGETQMPIDALLVGLIVLLICGAGMMYLYMRITFYERKGSTMESVLVDLRMAIDSLMHTVHRAPSPIAPQPEDMPQEVSASAPVPLDATEAETLPEENFYSSVLDLAHEEAKPEEQVVQGSQAEPLDTMTKNDLIAEAEKRGVRAKKSMSRNEILNLLRSASAPSNNNMTAGAENASSAAALDGGVIDLGQDSSSLD